MCIRDRPWLAVLAKLAVWSTTTWWPGPVPVFPGEGLAPDLALIHIPEPTRPY